MNVKRGVVAVAVLASLAVGTYLPLHLSAQHSQRQTAPQTAITSTTQLASAKVTVNHGETAWTYNFADQPDGSLTRRDWRFETGTTASDYHEEAQVYTNRPTNVRVENGILIIEAKSDNLMGKKYSSGRIDTKGHFDFTYGTFEAEIKVPKGVGTWPAVWLLPADNKYNPADYKISSGDQYAWALNGEIDVAESVGYIPGENIPAIHSYHEIQSPPTYTPGYVRDADTTFHRYGVIKTPKAITFTIDGVPYSTRNRIGTAPLDWPFDQSYYVVINLAVGGQWGGAKGIDAKTAPWQLQVKSLSYKPL